MYEQIKKQDRQCKDEYYQIQDKYESIWTDKYPKLVETLSSTETFLLLQSPEKVSLTLAKLNSVRNFNEKFIDDKWLQDAAKKLEADENKDTQKVKTNKRNFFQPYKKEDFQEIKGGDYLYWKYVDESKGIEYKGDDRFALVAQKIIEDNDEKIKYVYEGGEWTINSDDLVKEKVKWHSVQNALSYEQREDFKNYFDENDSLIWYDDGCREELKAVLERQEELAEKEAVGNQKSSESEFIGQEIEGKRFTKSDFADSLKSLGKKTGVAQSLPRNLQMF